MNTISDYQKSINAIIEAEKKGDISRKSCLVIIGKIVNAMIRELK